MGADMQVQQINIDYIQADNRLRVVDGDHVEGLVASIKEIGLQQPLQVRLKPRSKSVYLLVAGAHRLEACRKLDMETVPCSVVAVDELEARMQEIDENLFRHELTPLDRAAFLAERKRVYEEMHPETKAGVAGGKVRQGSATATIAFAEQTAEKLRLGRRTIESAVKMHNSLAPDVRARLAGTWIARSGKDLEALSRLPPTDQARVLAATDLDGDGKQAEKVAQIVKRLKGKTPAADQTSLEQRELVKLVKCWDSVSVATKKSFIEHLKDTPYLKDDNKAEVA